MATVTKAQICQDALRHLGVVDPGENPTADEQVLAERRFDSLMSELALDGLNAGIEDLAVPEWAQIPLMELVAHEISPSFGIASSPAIRLMALARLRRQQSEATVAELNQPIFRPTHL